MLRRLTPGTPALISAPSRRSLPERPRSVWHVDGVLTKRGERHDLECSLVGGCQHHEGARPVLVRPQPGHRGHTPAVTRREAREAVLGHRRYQVVADSLLMLEELGRDHRTDRVAPLILGTGATAPVAVEAGEGVCSAWLELSTQHIAIGHRTSIARRLPRRFSIGSRRTRVSGTVPV